MSEYADRFAADIALIDSRLAELFGIESFVGEKTAGLEVMADAMYYSVKNGGKRIRPVLCLEFCRLCGADVETALDVACAVEMIHTYSLIHDDLPCMDDDDMRRGKPSNHIVYGYANALLAGDGLLTYAFETVSKASKLSADARCRCILVLSSMAGAAGMIAGQVMDLANEGKNVSVDVLRETDRCKTGCLIEAACVLGCIAANGDDSVIECAKNYSRHLGIAFQITDDILDVTSTTEELGKPVGSDAENDKSTYVSHLGLEAAEKAAFEQTSLAIESIHGLKGNEFLSELASKLCGRKN